MVFLPHFGERRKRRSSLAPPKDTMNASTEVMDTIPKRDRYLNIILTQLLIKNLSITIRIRMVTINNCMEIAARLI